MKVVEFELYNEEVFFVVAIKCKNKRVKDIVDTLLSFRNVRAISIY